MAYLVAKTMDLSIASFVRPPTVVNFTFMICTSKDCMVAKHLFDALRLEFYSSEVL